MQALSLSEDSQSRGEQTDWWLSTWGINWWPAKSLLNSATDAHSSHYSNSGQYPFLPKFWGPKENNDPKTKDFSLDLVATQCGFGMEKVFLNVLASAKVCLVKNKVCVHWNAVQVRHSAAVFKLTTLCTKQIPNSMWIIWGKKVGSWYLLKLDLICVLYLPNKPLYSTYSVPGTVRCALQISTHLILKQALGVPHFTVEEVKARN